jgi:hypothetical protein
MNKEGIELLKEVLALHGWGGYGYQNGLVERGTLYLESEDGEVKRYKHSCNAKMMEEVDEKIKQYLSQIE